MNESLLLMQMSVTNKFVAENAWRTRYVIVCLGIVQTTMPRYASVAWDGLPR